RSCFSLIRPPSFYLFFLSASPPFQLYSLSLHDALPIFGLLERLDNFFPRIFPSPGQNFSACRFDLPALSGVPAVVVKFWPGDGRSEEHTSELQSRGQLVCSLLLEKKKTNSLYAHTPGLS